MLGLEKTLKLDLQLPCFPNEETEIHPPQLSNLPQAKLELMWPSFHQVILPFTLCGLVFKGLYNFFALKSQFLLYALGRIFMRILDAGFRDDKVGKYPRTCVHSPECKFKTQNLEQCSELLAPVLRWQKQLHPYGACWTSCLASS